ncbi:queuine tRNA-ribosyltransferase accessory subunit 2-like [Styela clava]
MKTDIVTVKGIRHGTFCNERNGVKKKTLFPTCMLSTNCGTVPNLSRETYSYIPVHLHPDVTEVPVQSVIDHESIFSSYAGWSGELMRLSKSSLLYVSTQDPLLSLKTRNKPDAVQNTTKAVSIWGNKGRIALDVEKHLQLISTLTPDIFEVLADGDTIAEDVSNKRVSKSFANSLKFLEQSLKLHKENERLQDSHFIVPLEGGHSVELRKKYAISALHLIKENSTIDKCSGFLVDGISPDKPISTHTIDLVKASLEGLPQDKPRFIHGARSPLNVIKLIECGIDVFDTSFAINLAQKNTAIVFSIPDSNHITETKNISTSNGAKFSEFGKNTLDLSDEIYKDSFEPLLKSCSCYTCTRHTRSYIHHLVSVNELLAPLLLTLHNLHHYLQFFDNLQKAVKAGSFSEFKSCFS